MKYKEKGGKSGGRWGKLGKETRVIEKVVKERYSIKKVQTVLRKEDDG